MRGLSSALIEVSPTTPMLVVVPTPKQRNGRLPMTIRSALAPALCLAAALSLTAAACGADADETSSSGVATLAESPDGAGSASADGADGSAADSSLIKAVDGVEAPEDPEEAFRLYEQCLANAGFADEGTIGLAEAGGASVEVDAETSEGDPQLADDDFDVDAWEEANSDCEPHLANALKGLELSPEQEAAFDDANLLYVRCMQDAGFDMSIDSDGFVDFINDGENVDFEAYDTADAECVAAAFEDNPDLEAILDEQTSGS
jgi:hypothetical protein